MGLFDKLKTFVGGGAPKMSFTSIEDSIPVTDTVIRYKINVEAEKELTVISVSEELKIVYLDDEGEEQEEVLVEDKDDGSNWSDEDNPFPGKISKDNPWQFGGLVIMKDDAKSELLQKYFADKQRNKMKLMLEVEIDVKEIGMLFDPSISREIKLL